MSKSVISEVEGVAGCLLMKRVIDITKVDPQVLTWAITSMAHRLNHAASEEKPAEDAINEALKVLENVVTVQKRIKHAEANIDKKQIDFLSTSYKNIRSISIIVRTNFMMHSVINNFHTSANFAL